MPTRPSLVCTGLMMLLLTSVGWAQDATPTSAPPPLTVRATIEPLEATIGDPLRYRVEVVFDEGADVKLRPLEGKVGALDIVDFGDEPPRHAGGKTTLARWYTLVPFVVGEQTLPAPKAEYLTPGFWYADVEGNSLVVNVRPMLAADAPAEIGDIAPPIEVPFDWRPYALVAAAIGLFGLVIAGFYLLVTRPRKRHVVPPPPPHEVALAALNHLKSQRYLEQGRFEAFYVELSAIARRYLEDALHLRAPEMTTEEFLNAAASNPRLTANQRRLLGEFLGQADLVKFARHMPSLEDTEAAFEAARRFIDETRPTTATGDPRRAAA